MKKSFLFTAGLVAFMGLAGTTVCQAASNLVLKARTIVWQPGISPDLSNQLNQAGARVPAFVQFTNALSLANHQVLSNSDVRLEEYYQDRAYAVSLPSQTFLSDTNVRSLIFAAEPVLPIDKLQFPLDTNKLACWAYDPRSNTVTVLVGFWKAADNNAIAQSFTNAGVTGVPYGANNSWAVIAPFPSITNLANQLPVKYIQIGPVPFLPLNSRARPKARTDEAQQINTSSAKPNYALSGNGVRIAICDDGVDQTHNDFHFVKPDGAADNKARFYVSNPKDGEHGTHVASIAAGNGANYSNPLQPFLQRGHAPEALIGDYPPFHGNAQQFYDALKTTGLKPPKTDVSNHSYVQSFTVYDLVAESLDIIVRGNAKVPAGPIPPRPSVWGAGNAGIAAPPFSDYTDVKGEEEEGYFSVYTSAKNTISVGSVDTDTRQRSTSSSCGPTFDGRIKPDLVAPGQHNAGFGIVAAWINTQSYGDAGGTSQAAPVVTGIIALMMQKYKKYQAEICPTCPKELPPAMYKAILIHTAEDLDKPVSTVASPNTDQPLLYGYGHGPDFATGYGLVNATGACAKIVQTGYRAQEVIAFTKDTRTWQMDVSPGSGPVKVVIAWDDLPGHILADETIPRLMNDLDLTLEEPIPGSPTPLIHKPLVPQPLDPGPNPEKGNANPVSIAAAQADAAPGDDHLNNVEMVSVNPPPGDWPTVGITWLITVTGHDIPTATNQPFSLVSSHPINPVKP